MRPLSEAQLGRLVAVIRDLMRAVHEELAAAGEDEVRQHPVLRDHQRVFDRRVLKALGFEEWRG